MKKTHLYKCTDCGAESHLLQAWENGRKLRPPLRERDGVDVGRVVVHRVLCWWCRTYHPPSEVDACMALPRKPSGNGSSASSMSSALDAGLLKQYSELWGFLTLAAYPDGTKRKTGRLSLSCDVDMLGLGLQDEETGQYAFLNGRSLDDLLLEAESRLSDGTMPWRASRFQGKGRR